MVRISVVVLCAVLSACGPLRIVPSGQETAQVSAKQSQAEQAEAAALAAAVQQANEKKTDYLLSGADLLQISVFGEKD
ncbi:MAG: hypothetical protein KGJ84_15315, partial [Elusimicrobia bacterium]|nr:hypothetical protein [Elusimicrobiota bacterium]